MIKRLVWLIFSLFCFLCHSELNAQAWRPVKELELYRPKVALKYAPLALLDRTPSVQFAVEVRSFQHQSFQLEGGYLFSYGSATNRFRGHKFRVGYRFYLHRSNNSSRNGFLGIIYMNKQVNVDGTAWVWRNNRSFQEILPVKVVNQTHGFYAQIGQVFPPFAGPLRAEMVMGAGVRLLDVSLKDAPEDAQLETNLNTNILNPVNREGEYTLFGFFLTLRIIYPFE